MVSINGVTVAFGERVLFDEIGFLINKGDRIGLTGKNGAGKSTLLKTIAGIQKPDSGSVAMPKDIVIAYLPQEMKHNEQETVRDEAAKGKAEILKLNEKINSIEKELQERTDYESESFTNLCVQLEELNHRLHILDAGSADEQIEKILMGLGFEPKDFDMPVGSFSGGWKMRVELAKLLLQNPDLLLLDEPTNHLDIESIQWLEEFLKAGNASVLLISHDRTFLDNVTNRTIEISKGRIYNYKAPYSKYIELRKQEIELQRNTQKNQQRFIEKTEKLIDQYRAKASKASFAQSLIKKLDKIDVIEVDEFETSSLRIKFPPAPHSGKIIMELTNVEKAYGDKQIFKNMDLIMTRGEKIALVGKNGVGKSTFTKIITERESHGGTVKIGHSVEMAYFAQDEAEKLDPELTVHDTIDHVAVGEIRKQIRGLLGAFMFGGDDIDKKVKVLSGGEKTRLALCKLLLTQANFIILDEPTNHLDIPSKERLKEALMNYDGTLLIVSHDRDFLKGLTNRVYEIKDQKITIHPMQLDEYLAYRKTTLKEMEAKQQKPKPVAEKTPVQEEKKLNQDQEKEKKKIQNRIQKLEEEISELEGKLKLLESEIENMDYADKAKTETTLGKYHEQKDLLAKKYEEWENLNTRI